MIQIRLSFITGRYHATPWGRHVNEGVPEWPPSPYRLVRALVDCWLRRRPEWSASRVESLLRPLAGEQPEFVLPPARASHTRSFLSSNDRDVMDRQKVFDPFVVLSRSITVRWPNSHLTAEQESDLQELLAELNYLGRSESWVCATLSSSDKVLEANCCPGNQVDVAQESVLVACPSLEFAGKARKKTQFSPWLDALCKSTAEVTKEGWSIPPAMEFVPYVRRRDCFSPRSVTPSKKESHRISAVLVALQCKVRPRITQTVAIAERFRRAAMSKHVAPSEHFSGKRADGTLLMDHKHAYFLPLSLMKDGYLDHIAVVLRGKETAKTNSHEFKPSELTALDRVSKLWAAHAEGIRCVPVRWVERPDELPVFAPSQIFESATPFIPARHHKRSRGSFEEWLCDQVRLEFSRCYGVEPVSVSLTSGHTLCSGQVVRWFEFLRGRRDTAPRSGYGFRVEFSEPLAGPLAIGKHCHFGLGLFRPAPEAL